ncbi:MAG: hypothetical protein ACOVQ7_12400 [Limnoraphis robusta]
MARKKSAKFSKLNPEEWAKYTAVKFGTASYTVDRAAPPEDKERYACGVIPFGISAPASGGSKKTAISRAAAKFCAAMGGTAYSEFGIETNAANAGAPPDGWYAALCFITLRAPEATSSTATSQLTGRKYKKYRTRAASIPFGRRSKATPRADDPATPTTDTNDRDYEDCKTAIVAFVRGSGGSAGAFGSSYEVASLSFENEIWQPQASSLASLSTLTSPGTITAF